MGVAVRDFSHFKHHFEAAQNDADLFAFLLYSNRESHQPVAQFVSTHVWFIDELAVRQEMYFYFFVLKRSNAQDNPAAEMTNLFGIQLGELPGLVLFDKAGLSDKKGVFFPIRVELFQDSARAELRLTELFDDIGMLRRKVGKAEELVSELSGLLPRWKRQEQMRPIWDYALGQSRRLVNLPSDLITKMAEGFAKGLIGGVG